MKTIFTILAVALTVTAIEAQAQTFGCYKEIRLNDGTTAEQGCASVTVTATTAAEAAGKCKASGKCCVYPPSAGVATKARAKQMGNLPNAADVGCQP